MEHWCKKNQNHRSTAQKAKETKPESLQMTQMTFWKKNFHDNVIKKSKK